MADYTCVGEIMLRLKSSANERFFQSPNFEATFGGGDTVSEVEKLMRGDASGRVQR